MTKPEYISNIEWNLALEKHTEKELFELIDKKYPIQYIIGNVEFLNTVICVDERALIPRFETELLVDKTIKIIRNLNLSKVNILELGTGSGCISIALKKNIMCDITAVDISRDALELASSNAHQNNADIHFLESNMLDVDFSNIDIIISNPPYVSVDEEVGKETKYEPSLALYAANKGLYFYEEIMKKISNEPANIKLIAFEIGEAQRESIMQLAKKYLSTYNCVIEKDLTNRDRFAFISKIE